jgi:hypothetical protein
MVCTSTKIFSSARGFANLDCAKKAPEAMMRLNATIRHLISFLPEKNTLYLTAAQ